MDAKLARGVTRQALQQLANSDPSQAIDPIIADLTETYARKGLSVAGRKAFVKRFEALPQNTEAHFALIRHAVNRLQKTDTVILVYPTIGSVEQEGRQEAYITLAGLKIEMGSKSAKLSIPSDSVLISEHALLRFYERSPVEPEEGIASFFKAFWPSMPLSLIMLKVAESTALPPVAALPVFEGMLLGVRSRIASGTPRGLEYDITHEGTQARHLANSVLSRKGKHYYLNFRTFIGAQEIAPAQARVQEELMRFVTQTPFPIEELFLSLLFNDSKVADVTMMAQHFRWHELNPLLSAFLKKDWASVVPKELRTALGIERLVSDQ